MRDSPFIGKLFDSICFTSNTYACSFLPLFLPGSWLPGRASGVKRSHTFIHVGGSGGGLWGEMNAEKVDAGNTNLEQGPPPVRLSVRCPKACGNTAVVASTYTERSLP